MNTADATNATKQGIGPENAENHGKKTFTNTIPNQDTDIKKGIITKDDQVSDSEYELLEVNEINIRVHEFDNDLTVETSNLSINPKGNLKKHIQFWYEIGAPQFILNIIRDGYKLPFKYIPKQNVLKNNRSAEKHSEFVNEALAELLKSGRIIESKIRPHAVNPLSVSVQATGKKRLILDLRYINKYLKKFKVKYEDWKIGIAYFERSAYMFSFDLKSGYHHVEIHPEHQTYLGFAWKSTETKETKFYVFTVLPFGLSTAPYIFTKILKPLEKHWRYLNINIAIFLDDGWSIAKNFSVCRCNSETVKRDLHRAGFVSNQKKISLVANPSVRLAWTPVEY